jgi:hypothetical protein
MGHVRPPAGRNPNSGGRGWLGLVVEPRDPRRCRGGTAVPFEIHRGGLVVGGRCRRDAALRTDDDDRARRMCDDLLGHRSEQQPAEAAEATSGHDQEFGLGGAMAQQDSDASDLHLPGDDHTLVWELGEQPVQELLTSRDEFVVAGEGRDDGKGQDIRPRHGVDDLDMRAAETSFVDGPPQRAVRVLGPVDADDDACQRPLLGRSGVSSVSPRISSVRAGSYAKPEIDWVTVQPVAATAPRVNAPERTPAAIQTTARCRARARSANSR